MKNRKIFVFLAIATLGMLPTEYAAAEDIKREFPPLFRPLAEVMSAEGREIIVPKVTLGRKPCFEPRLSISGEISCNSRHLLDEYGADGLPTSTGHEGKFGTRNSPSAFNAALHVARFGDGRSPDVEPSEIHQE